MLKVTEMQIISYFTEQQFSRRPLGGDKSVSEPLFSEESRSSLLSGKEVYALTILAGKTRKEMTICWK